MSLLDRLRPAWRDSDPQVRRDAVRDLDDLATLRQLAEADDDAAVREAAAARVRGVLVATATSDGPLAACSEALEQLADEAAAADVATRAAHAEIRAAALGRVTTARLLRDVVRAAADPATRDAALARIDDPDVLRRIAVGDVPAETALAALARIDDLAVLAAIAEHPDASKTVRGRARERIPADAPALRPGDVRARQHALMVELDGFAEAWDCEGIGEQIRQATEEWHRLAREVAPIDEIAARFERAREAATIAVATWERRRAEQLHVETTHAERTRLIERIEALDGGDAAAFEEARRAWSALDPLPDEDGRELARRMRAACELFEARRAGVTARRALLEDLEGIAGEAARLAEGPEPPTARLWKEVTKRWRLRLPADDASEEIASLAARFDAAAERVRTMRQEAGRTREQTQQQNLARLEQLMTRMDAAATAETIAMRSARRDLAAAETALEDLGPLPAAEDRKAWKARLEIGHDLLLRRIRQAEEAEAWHRFANAGVQEQLIARVQALLDSGDLAAASKELGAIQREWERAATAPRDRSAELWNRFRTARNELRKRVAAYQAENVGRKQALCDAAALLAESTDWNATTSELQRLQAEWKAIGPVPAKHAESLWRRFREPCDRFFARRKEHFGRLDAAHDENAKRKLALIEQAEALAGSKDWEETTKVLKRLQAKWKEIGPVSRRDADALWKRFRGACDRFFDRRSRRDDLEREEQVEAATAAIDAFVTAADAADGNDAPPAEELGRLLDAAWTALHELDDEPGADTRALGERFREACARVGAAHPDALRGTRVDPDATRKRREKICARLESLLDVALARPKPLTLEEQALRLKERLAAKTIGGAADEEERRRDEARAEIRRLRAQWERLGPPLGDESLALATRFEESCARLDADPTRKSG